MREKTKRVRCQDLFVVLTAWSPLQDVRRQVHLRVCITLTRLFAVAELLHIKGPRKIKMGTFISCVKITQSKG